ncbi:MAG: GGDEF domain-containing protein [Synergistaceae bacterium]|nr:GGDEF domain-containing protein [Synergistaceae bacterium]
MNVWREVLDSCPGLLCCVINLKGRLIYATKGYKATASRLFGHECSEGRNYPPMITEIDRALHDILTGACLGRTNSIEVSEDGKAGKIWEITASPLRLKDNDNEVSGVVLRVISSENASQTQQPIIQSNPDILNSVPFRACIVNQSGDFLAVNKFLAQSAKINLIGHNISEFIANDDISEILLRRSGWFECSMSGFKDDGNFYTFSDDDYLDKDFNAAPQVQVQDEELRNIRIHASPIEWDGSESVMLTFEDFTDIKKTHEQLRRVLTFDNHTGVLNRRGMEHMILRDLNASIKYSSQLSLIMLKIDNFREILEGTGYLSGGRLLRDFVRITKRAVSGRHTGVLGRWSDDEFAVLTQCSGAAAVVLANDIRLRVDGVKLSAGVADLNSGAYYGVNDFVAAAYDAMIDAKKSGGNQTKISR